MNILHVCGTKRVSGLELLACNIVHRMHNDGHTVFIAARDKCGLAKLTELHNIPSVNYHGGFTRLWYPLQVRSYIKKNRIDIVHFHHLRFLKRLMPFLPYGESRPAYLFTDATPYKMSVSSMYVRHVLSRLDLLMVCSASHKGVAADALGYSEDKIVVLENGVDTDVFSPPVNVEQKKMLKREFGIPLNVPCIALVGRVDESKGQDTLIEAVRILIGQGRQLQVEICGELEQVGNGGAGYVRRIKEMAADKSLNGSVNLRGFVQDVSRFMKAIDVLVVPSVREPFGLVAAEAMATELPVIVSDAGALPAIVPHNECGLVFSSGSAEQLATAVGKLLDDERCVLSMGKCGRQRVIEQYSFDKHLSGLYDLYKEAMDKRRS